MKTVLQGNSISQLSDGYTGRALDAAFGELCRDIEDRGSDGKKRTITVTFDFTPGREGRVEIATKVALKIPPQVPPKTIAKMDEKAGGLIFNPDVRDHPDQQTFNDLDVDTAKE
jgi:hypothetical protein